MFRHEIKKYGAAWEVASAGTKAYKNGFPNKGIAQGVRNLGMSIDNHRSQPVTPRLLKKYYWIMVMETAHKDEILASNPDLKGRVFTLREFGIDSPVEDPNVPDPTFESELGYYEEFLDILNYEIPRIAKVLQYKVSDLKIVESGDDFEAC